MSDFKYKGNLKPKEYHPMVPYCQEIFLAAGPEYIKYLMDYLKDTIQSERDEVHPEENDNGVVYETLRMIMEGEKLNDRYLMGATLFVIHSLIPAADVIKRRVEELSNKNNEPDTQEEIESDES